MPHKPFKENLKGTLTKVNANMNTWDHIGSYRVRDVNLIAVGLKEFQNNKVAHA